MPFDTPRLYYFVPVERRALRENSKLFFQSVSLARNDLDQLLSTECFWHVPVGYSAMEALAERGCGQCCDIAIPAQRNITFTKKQAAKATPSSTNMKSCHPSTYFQIKFYQKGLYLTDITITSRLIFNKSCQKILIFPPNSPTPCKFHSKSRYN